ncbi:MAG: HU family DNA-binding protein [Prevotella sp.]|nr:HU family DNA-binding protein [Prevotella sp.]
MAICYRKVQNTSAGSKTFGKWYGRSVIIDTVSTKQLAEEISHSTTVTYADVCAVLAAMSTAMKGHLQNSHKVVLDGIGSFRVGLKTLPAATSADFDSSKIAGYRIIYGPEKHFNATGSNEMGNRTGFFIKDLLSGISAKEAPKNAVVDTPAEAGA